MLTKDLSDCMLLNVGSSLVIYPPNNQTVEGSLNNDFFHTNPWTPKKITWEVEVVHGK